LNLYKHHHLTPAKKRLILFITLLLLCTNIVFAQQASTNHDRLIVKSNLLNLLAKRPAISIEKAFNKTSSAEISFVWGQFDRVLLADRYEYSGALLRVKKHFNEIKTSRLNPYIGIYAGSLYRDIKRDSYVDNTGFFGYRGKDFAANSIRTGFSGGLSYITSNHFIIEAQNSYGYGRYFNIKRSDNDANAKGYLDVQVWFSVGYCF